MSLLVSKSAMVPGQYFRVDVDNSSAWVNQFLYSVWLQRTRRYNAPRKSSMQFISRLCFLRSPIASDGLRNLRRATQV